MTRFNLDEGNRGEDIACEYLLSKGFVIIERNFRLKGGEIDIIATKDSTLIFIEVKTRTTLKFGTGLEAITSWKLKALVKSANFYKITHKNLPESMRIDVISLVLDHAGGVKSLEHIENITL
jgi:putative endonuclease